MGQRVCPSCRHYIDNLALYCPLCGAPTPVKASEDGQRRAAGRLRVLRRAAVLAVCVLFVAWAWQCASGMLPSGFETEQGAGP